MKNTNVSWLLVASLAALGCGAVGCGSDAGGTPTPTPATAHEEQDLDLANDPALSVATDDLPSAQDLAELAAHASDTRVDGLRLDGTVAPKMEDAPKFKDVRANAARLGLPLDSESDTATVPEATMAAATTSNAIHIHGYKQLHSDWCAPASGQTAISAFDSTPPSQATIAAAMHTNHGTTLPNVAPALNRYQHRNNYMLSTVTSTSGLFNLVHFNTNFPHAPLVAGVRGKYLPTWAAHGFDGFHAIALYGWIQSGSRYWIRTWDPLQVSWSGAHAFPASTVMTAVRGFTSQVVW